MGNEEVVVMSRSPLLIAGHHVRNPELISLGVKEKILAYAASSTVIAVAKTVDLWALEEPWPMDRFQYFSIPPRSSHRSTPFHHSPAWSSSSLVSSSSHNDSITVIQVHPIKDYLCVGTEHSGLYLTKASHPILSSVTRIPLEFSGETIHSACFLTMSGETGEDNMEKGCLTTKNGRHAISSNFSIPGNPSQQPSKNVWEDYLVFSSSFTAGSPNHGASHRLSLWSITEGRIAWRCASEPFRSMCSFYSCLSFAACSSDNLVQVYTVKRKEFSTGHSSSHSKDTHKQDEEGTTKNNNSKKTETVGEEKKEDEEDRMEEFLLWSLTCATPDVWSTRPMFVSCATFPAPFCSLSNAEARGEDVGKRTIATAERTRPQDWGEEEKQTGKAKDMGKPIGTEEAPPEPLDSFFVALTANGILVEYDRRNGTVQKWMDSTDPQATGLLTSSKYITICGSAVRYFDASTWELSGIYRPVGARPWSGAGGSNLFSSSSSSSTTGAVAVSSLTLHDGSLAIVLLRDGSILTFSVSDDVETKKGHHSQVESSGKNRESPEQRGRNGMRRMLRFARRYHYVPLVDPLVPGARRGAGGGSVQGEEEERRCGVGSSSLHLFASAAACSPLLQWVHPSLDKEQHSDKPLPCALWCPLGIRVVDSENLNNVIQYPLRFNCGVFDVQRNILFAQCKQTNEIHALDPHEMWGVKASVSVSLPLISLSISPEGLIVGLGENQMLYFFFCKGEHPSIVLEQRRAHRNLNGMGVFHQLLFAGEKLYAVSSTYLMNTSSNKEFHWKERILQVASIGTQHFLLLFSNHGEMFDPGDPDEHLCVFSLPFTATLEATMTVEAHHQRLVLIEQACRLLVFDLDGMGAPLLFFDYSIRNPGVQITLTAFIRTKTEERWRLLVADSDTVVSIYDIFQQEKSPLFSVGASSYKDSVHPPLQQPPLAPRSKTPSGGGGILQKKHSVKAGGGLHRVKSEEVSPDSGRPFFLSSGPSFSKRRDLHPSNTLRASCTAVSAKPILSPSEYQEEGIPAVSTSSPPQEENQTRGRKMAMVKGDARLGKEDAIHEGGSHHRSSSTPPAPSSEQLSDRFSELTNFFQSQAFHTAPRSERRQLRKSSSNSSSPVSLLSFPMDASSRERNGTFGDEEKAEEQKGNGEEQEEEGEKGDGGGSPSSLSPLSCRSPPTAASSSRGGALHSSALHTGSRGSRQSSPGGTTPSVVAFPPGFHLFEDHSPSEMRTEERHARCDVLSTPDDTPDVPCVSSALASVETPVSPAQKPMTSVKWGSGEDERDGSTANMEDVVMEDRATSAQVRGPEMEVSDLAVHGVPNTSSKSPVEDQCEAHAGDVLQPVARGVHAKRTSSPPISSSLSPSLAAMEEEEDVNPQPFPEELTTCTSSFGISHRATIGVSTASCSCPSMKEQKPHGEQGTEAERTHPHEISGRRDRLRQSLVELTNLLSGADGINALQKHPDEFMELYDTLSATLQISSMSSTSSTLSALEPMHTRKEALWDSQNLRLEVRRIQEQNDLLAAQNQEILRVLQEEKRTKK